MEQNRRPRTTAALLFIDMLGVRASWVRNGRAGAEESFSLLQIEIRKAMLQLSRADILDAAMESDSVAIKCRSAEVAALLAIRIFRRTFGHGSSRKKDKRVWLRGVIIPISTSAKFRTPANISLSPVPLINVTYHKKLMDAIAIEKSGYRGMRCLIQKNLVTTALHRRFRFMIGQHELPRFRHLTHSHYPPRVGTKFQDILWMNPHRNIGEWDTYKRYMGDRLRYAGHKPEELNQAAATQIVFHECEAMIYSRKKKLPQGGADTIS